MATYDEQEKRSKPRRPFNHSIIFDFIDIELGYLRNINYTGVGFDISESGLGMMLDYALKRAQVVKLYIPIEEKNAHLPIFAEVMWSRADNNQFKTGMRFLHLNVTNFGLDL